MTSTQENPPEVTNQPGGILEKGNNNDSQRKSITSLTDNSESLPFWDDIIQSPFTPLTTTANGKRHWKVIGKQGPALTLDENHDVLNVLRDGLTIPKGFYNRFDAYAEFHHQGDHGAARATLAAEGYQPPPGPGMWQDDGLTSHMRIAARFAQYARPRSLWLHGSGWRKWTGTHWAADHHAVVAHQQLKDVVRTSWSEALDDKDLAAAVRAANTGPGARSVIDLASRELFVESMDTNPWLLNTQNGTLDLRTPEPELRPHNPADQLSKITGAAYHPDAHSREWKRFLAEALPDPEVRAYLQRFAGQALIGKTQEHILAILNGREGRNGKSVTANLLSKALGDYATTVPNDLLIAGKYGGRSAGDLAALMQLRGTRLAVMSELNEGDRMNESDMKQYTGGDTITSKAMGQNFVTWEPTHSFLMLTNYLPEVQGDSKAAWARIHVVPFTVSFEGREDPNLEDRLKQNALDAVLAWAVEGLRDYYQQRLSPPNAVKAETEDYRASNDPVTRFIDERCFEGPAASVNKSKLLQEYNQWARANGETTMSGKRFTPQINARPGVSLDRGRRGFQGIGLHPELQE